MEELCGKCVDLFFIDLRLNCLSFSYFSSQRQFPWAEPVKSLQFIFIRFFLTGLMRILKSIFDLQFSADIVNRTGNLY